MGAASTMLDDDASLDSETRHDLTQAIFEESERLQRLLTNLLHMTRLEAGPVQIRKDWQPIEEVIGAALTRLELRLRDRQVTTHLPEKLTSAPFDGALIEQVLVNLIENALRYTPQASPIEISAVASEEMVTIEVADRGPGIGPGQEDKIFENFTAPNVGAVMAAWASALRFALAFFARTVGRSGSRTVPAAERPLVRSSARR